MVGELNLPITSPMLVQGKNNSTYRCWHQLYTVHLHSHLLQCNLIAFPSAFTKSLVQQCGKRQSDDYEATYDPNPCPMSDTDVLRYDAMGLRSSNFLANVQNQGSCGSCWAFASSQMHTVYLTISLGRKLITISPQQATECVFTDRNGCCGGNGIAATQYFESVGSVQYKP